MSLYVDVDLKKIQEMCEAFERTARDISSVSNMLMREADRAKGGMQDSSTEIVFQRIHENATSLRTIAREASDNAFILESYKQALESSECYYRSYYAIDYIKADMNSISAFNAYLQTTVNDVINGIQRGREAFEAKERYEEECLIHAEKELEAAISYLNQAEAKYKSAEYVTVYDVASGKTITVLNTPNPYAGMVEKATKEVNKAEQEKDYWENKLQTTGKAKKEWLNEQERLLADYSNFLNDSDKFYNWYYNKIMEAQKKLNN